MQTFEEFIAKKKIDLLLFQKAEPVLSAEFRSHYEQMGEKSFDHSKKFLFNKIRRTYHLKEEPKPVKETIEITEIASQAEPLTSPSIEQKPAFTPRFRPGITSTKPSEEKTTTENPVTAPTASENQEEKPKPAYQPRFKMQSVVKQEIKQEETKIEAPEIPSEQQQQKPAAYKPKFNMKNIKPKSEE